MTEWQAQISALIEPAVARSKVTDAVVIGRGVLAQAGQIAAQVTDQRRALVMADDAGFGAAGAATVASLEAAGFAVSSIVLPSTPLPKASVEEAEPFRAALAADPLLFPISVGSGVINDLVKFAAFQTDRRYCSVATAASMDGYTSAGAPLAEGGFKITIPTRAPIAMLADLDVIAAAPAEMNGWGYGDLAGKIPAGGDWILADALGVEPLDAAAWPLVQDHLRGWLAGPKGILTGDSDGAARLFVGLTAVGFAMEVHGSSRPASGAEHQIAHLWEMEGHDFKGRKVSHGAAVGVGTVASLALYDWLLEQDLATLDIDQAVAQAPNLARRLTWVERDIPNAVVAAKAQDEICAKHVDVAGLTARLTQLTKVWPDVRARLKTHLYRFDEMAHMLSQAGAPAFAGQIGVTPSHLRRTLQGAVHIRRRYTVLDLLHETGLTEAALRDVLPRLCPQSSEAAQ